MDFWKGRTLMKMRWTIRLAIALILAVVIPACHHSARKNPPPGEQTDPGAAPQKP